MKGAIFIHNLFFLLSIISLLKEMEISSRETFLILSVFGVDSILLIFAIPAKAEI